MVPAESDSEKATTVTPNLDSPLRFGYRKVTQTISLPSTFISGSASNHSEPSVFLSSDAQSVLDSGECSLITVSLLSVAHLQHFCLGVNAAKGGTTGGLSDLKSPCDSGECCLAFCSILQFISKCFSHSVANGDSGPSVSDLQSPSDCSKSCLHMFQKLCVIV